MDKSLKCTWSTEGASGTSWIKDGKFYTEVSAQGYNSKAIMKDNCTWAWSDAQAQGVKTCYESEEEMYTEMEKSEQSGQTESNQTTEGVALLSDVTYDCQPANIADSKFEPPNNVNFIDMDEMMPQSTEDLQEMSEEDIQEMQDKVQDMLPEGM